MMRRKKLMAGVLGIGIIGFIGLQVIPAGSIRPVLARKANPPVTRTIVWDSADTERVVRAACYDCHSNETAYPWYAQLAPVSWLVSRDVNKGREAMNFSEDVLTQGDWNDLEYHLFHDMPPKVYLVMHPEAKLSVEQKTALLEGFKATFSEAAPEGADDGMDMGSES